MGNTLGKINEIHILFCTEPFNEYYFSYKVEERLINKACLRWRQSRNDSRCLGSDVKYSFPSLFSAVEVDYRLFTNVVRNVDVRSIFFS